MATSLEEITPTHLKSFAEKKVREFIASTTKYHVFALMDEKGDVAVRTTLDDRKFLVVRNTWEKTIKLYGPGIPSDGKLL